MDLAELRIVFIVFVNKLIYRARFLERCLNIKASVFRRKKYISNWSNHNADRFVFCKIIVSKKIFSDSKKVFLRCA